MNLGRENQAAVKSRQQLLTTQEVGGVSKYLHFFRYMSKTVTLVMLPHVCALYSLYSVNFNSSVLTKVNKEDNADAKDRQQLSTTQNNEEGLSKNVHPTSAPPSYPKESRQFTFDDVENDLSTISASLNNIHNETFPNPCNGASSSCQSNQEELHSSSITLLLVHQFTNSESTETPRIYKLCIENEIHGGVDDIFHNSSNKAISASCPLLSSNISKDKLSTLFAEPYLSPNIESRSPCNAIRRCTIAIENNQSMLGPIDTQGIALHKMDTAFESLFR